MNFSKLGLVTLGVSLSFWTVSATDISNLKATPNGNTLEITWNSLDNSEMTAVDGYAIQWGTQQNNIRNDKSPVKTVSGDVVSLALRSAGFEREIPYFFRVYTYVYEGRGKYTLTNGSQILKWTWKENGETETSSVEPNDPVIVDNTTTSSDDDVFTFGTLHGGRPFDTSVQMQWSRPSISKNRYDGFQIVVSKSSTLSSPIGTLKANKTQLKGYISGLEPNTKYYAAGEFVKNGVTFGRGPVMSFQTSTKFSTAQQAKFERTFGRMQKIGIGAQVNFGGSDSTPPTTVDSTKTETTSTENTSTSNDDADDLATQIKNLRKQIATLQAQLRDLQNKQTESTRNQHISRRSRTSNVNSRNTTRSARTSTSSRSYRTSTRSNSRFHRKTQPTRRTNSSMRNSAPNNRPVLNY